MKDNELFITIQLRDGNSNAFKYIYDHYYALLCSIAYTFTKDDFVAQNIVDDLIFSLWEQRKSISIETSLRSYLMRAVKNRCINYLNLKRETSEINFSQISYTQDEFISQNYAEEDPWVRLIEKDLEDEIARAIENLPKDCRIIFKMSRIEEKKYAEIAKGLHISIDTVKYHMKNALAILKEVLGKYLTAFFVFLYTFSQH